jgi:hypothetical protein
MWGDNELAHTITLDTTAHGFGRSSRVWDVTFTWEETGKTPNGTPWPVTHETHSQEQINSAFRSPGSYIPIDVIYANNALQANLDRIAAETGITDPRELIRLRVKELGHVPGTLVERR